MADITKTIEIKVETKKAVKGIKELNKSMDKNQKEVKESTEESKKYEKQIEKTGEATSGLTGKLDAMTGGALSSAKGIVTSIKALKGFKIALAATGIGAVLLLITSLVQSFKRTEEGGDRLNKIMRVIGAVLDNFLDILGDVGTGIIDALVNPMETVTKLWEGLKSFFANPLGSIKAGYEAVKVAIQDVVEEIGNDIEAATELADLEARTNRLERQFWVDQANAERNIAGLRLKARQEKKFTAAERLEFQKQALEELDALAAKEEEVAKGRLAIVLQSNELANSNAEALDEAARLEATLINVQTRRLTQSIRLTSQINVLRDEAAAEAAAALKGNTDVNAAITERLRLTNELIALNDQILKEGEEEIALSLELDDINTLRLESQKETAEETIETQDKLNESLQLTGQAAQGVLDIFAGKTTGKDIFKFFLTTLGAILSLVNPAKSGGAVVGLIGGLFADGGMINGPSHRGGGTWINTEGGEAVINKRAMAIPWARNLASELNQIGGGVSFGDGGITPGPTAQEAQINDLTASLQQQRIVLPIEDLFTLETKVTAIEDRATL